MTNNTKKDFLAVTVIGALVGLLVQPVIVNIIQAPSMTMRIAVFFVLLILAPVALFVASLLGKYIPVLYQFAKFAAVGTLNSMIDAGVFNLIVYATGIATGLGASSFKAISFIGATTNSFFWNKYWTFNAKGTVSASETSKFYVIAIVGWVLNVSAFTIVNGLPHSASLTPKQWANVALLCGIAAAFLWDFLGYKFLVFKTHEPEKTSTPVV